MAPLDVQWPLPALFGAEQCQKYGHDGRGQAQNTVYKGEQRCWDFERYVDVHKQQHSVMEGLVEHGYTGIDTHSKVRYLLNGIKTDKFDAVKTRIMSDERLRVAFDACVTLYQDYSRQTNNC